MARSAGGADVMSDEFEDALAELDDLYTELDPPAPAGPRFSMRVVLIDPPAKFDKGAVRSELLSAELLKGIRKGNEVLHDFAHLMRFAEYRGRLNFECYETVALEKMPDDAFHEVVAGLGAVFYDLDRPEPFLGSRMEGMRRYADALHDMLAERVRRELIRLETQARAKSPLEAVKDEGGIRKLIEGALGALPVRGPETVDEADEMAAEVHAQAPWFSAATSEIWRAMRGELEQGRPPWFRPILLVGDPGVGKTTLGRVLAAEMGTPIVEIDAGSGGAAFSIAGLEKGWASAGIGRPLEAILRHRVANPLVLVNEVDRIGGGLTTANSGSRTSMSDALLPLLDRESAERWTCAATRLQFDMSKVLWVLTSNSLHGVDPALLSRCRVFTVPRPAPQHVAAITREALGDLDPDLADQAADMVAREWSRRSITLRQVDAMIDRIRRALTGPRLH
jgi:hypothetical protein